MITVSKEGRPEPRFPKCKRWKEVFTTHNRLTQGADVETNGKEYRVTLYPAGEAWVSYFDLDDGPFVESYVREFLEESYGDAIDYVAETYSFTSEAYDFMEYMGWYPSDVYDACIYDDDLDNYIKDSELTDKYPTKEEQDTLKKSILDSIQAACVDQKEYYSDLRNLSAAL